MKERWKRMIWALVRVIQFILITVLLSLVYLVVVGVMHMVARLFRPRLMRDAAPGAKQSYWEDVTDGDPDEQDCLRQS